MLLALTLQSLLMYTFPVNCELALQINAIKHGIEVD